MDSKKHKMIGIAAVIVAVMLVISLLSSSMGGGAGSAEDAALKYVNALFKPDAKTIYSLLPKDVKKPADGKTLNEIIQQADQVLTRQLHQIDDLVGENWKYSCKVTESNEVSESSLEWLQERYETKYKLKVTEAQKVRVAVTITAGNDKDTESTTVPVIKVGNSWYLNWEDMYDLSLNGF